MKVQETKIENKIITQVFISKEEAEDDEIKQKVEDMKKQGNKVVVFSAGEKEIGKTLKAMLQVMQDRVVVNY